MNFNLETKTQNSESLRNYPYKKKKVKGEEREETIGEGTWKIETNSRQKETAEFLERRCARGKKDVERDENRKEEGGKKRQRKRESGET